MKLKLYHTELGLDLVRNIEILKNKKPKKVIGEACVATALYAVATSLVRHAQDKIRNKNGKKKKKTNCLLLFC